ncbi:MAG: hypothetical protein M3A44_08535 [Gammaproteobacteria bacterium]
MNISTRLYLGYLGLFFSALSLNSLPVSADMNRACRLDGSYGYLYNGTSYMPTGTLSLTETGILSAGNSGNLGGEGILVFQFSNFSGKGPLWLLLREVQSGGVVTPDTNIPCAGVINFVATATVIKTSNPAIVPEGTVLFANSPRSIAYTISGSKNEVVDIISTSPGTVASGVAHKQDKNKSKNGDSNRSEND